MLREMLKRHEGYSSAPYKCPAGRLTIGWGHNLDANILPRDIEIYLGTYHLITPDMAERLLTIDINLAESACKRLFRDFDKFTDTRKSALIDMMFNLGAKGVGGFKKMIAAIKKGDWAEAARQINDSAYWRQLGGDPKGADDGKLERPEEIAKMIKEG